MSQTPEIPFVVRLRIGLSAIGALATFVLVMLASAELYRQYVASQVPDPICPAPPAPTKSKGKTK